MLPVKYGEPNDWETREDDIVEIVHQDVVDGGSREVGVESKEPNRPYIQDILVEHVGDEVRVAAIGFAPVTQEEVLQETELPNRVVGGACSLLSF